MFKLFCAILQVGTHFDTVLRRKPVYTGSQEEEI